MSRRRRVGVALGRESAVAAWRDGSATRTVTVAVDTHGVDGVEQAFADALSALAARVAEVSGRAQKGTRVRVALLPPLAEARLVPLPPLRYAEALAVLHRDAARHFVGPTGGRVVAVARRRASANAPLLAAIAEASVVEALMASAARAGWRVDAVAPAQAAWFAALASTGVVVAADGDTVHVLRQENGAPVVLRRVPADAPGEVVQAAGAAAGSALVLAEAAQRTSLSRALSTAGWTVGEPAGTAGEAAATHVADAALELVPESMAQERRVRARRQALRLTAAAILVVTGAAGVESWGAQRELAALRAARAAIREDVTPLLAARDSLERLQRRVAEIDALAQASPRWTSALFDLAMLLPTDAHLTALHASGDTLEIEASGARAGAALQALRDAESLRDVRLLGTVQRELEDGSTSVERFRLSARIAPPAEENARSDVPHQLPVQAQLPGARDVAARRTP